MLPWPLELSIVPNHTENSKELAPNHYICYLFLHLHNLHSLICMIFMALFAQFSWFNLYGLHDFLLVWQTPVFLTFGDDVSSIYRPSLGEALIRPSFTCIICKAVIYQYPLCKSDIYQYLNKPTPTSKLTRLASKSTLWGRHLLVPYDTGWCLSA